MTERTVHVVNLRDQDISDSARYGKVKILSSGNVDIFDPKEFFEGMREKIKDSHPDDYVLLCGPVLINAWFLVLWFSWHRKARCLIFSARKEKYVERYITESDVYGYPLNVEGEEINGNRNEDETQRPGVEVQGDQRP